MKKEEFASKLREKLSILEEKEIDDIIEEYLGYIDEKMQKGTKEEEAIKDFGDIDELARELLKAYKINVEKSKEKNFLNVLVEKINNTLDSFIKVFENKDGRQICRMIVEILLILLCISICQLPFHFLENIGFDVFMTFQNNFGKTLFHIWKFIMEFTYLILAIVLFIKIFEKRYFKNIETEKEIKPKPDNQKSTSKSTIKEETVQMEKTQKKGIIDLLTTICLWFIKFIASLFLFGIGCYILGLAICMGICLYLMIKGVTYFGIYISILFLLILGILSFILLFNWIFNRKNNIKFLLVSYILSFIILGISFSYTSIEIATTKFINELPENYTLKEKSEIIPFDEKKILFGQYEFEEDETLLNEIKVTYEYPENLYEIITDIDYQNSNKIYISWNYLQNFWPTKLLENIINDLKNHELHNYTMIPKITVYTSHENIEILKKNHQNWMNQKRYQNNYYDYCEELYEDNEILPLDCKELLFPNDNEQNG